MAVLCIRSKTDTYMTGFIGNPITALVVALVLAGAAAAGYSNNNARWALALWLIAGLVGAVALAEFAWRNGWRLQSPITRRPGGQHLPPAVPILTPGTDAIPIEPRHSPSTPPEGLPASVSKGPHPPAGVTCKWPAPAASGPYYVGVWVNPESEVMIVVTSSAPMEAEFSAEFVRTQNLRHRVKLRPWQMHWADGSVACTLRPGAYSVLPVGRLDTVGQLARVLWLTSPDGDILLEPGGVANPEDAPEHIRSLKMLGIRFRVTYDGRRLETFELLMAVSPPDQVELRVMRLPAENDDHRD